jgi:hypothetical protein
MSKTLPQIGGPKNLHPPRAVRDALPTMSAPRGTITFTPPPDAHKRLRSLRRRAKWRSFRYRVRSTWLVATGRAEVGCDCELWDD